ncbi:zinc ribbon domain-containing protein [Tannockella kyphosi]|uniref:zinc ribbon domain-containing protein n=1 Tax=Tannockella kyphosi TaxID=2899121 RepID=UPI0020111948|nr:zinc ribbon domain-containing protein [Tannockella kyphosi]
MQITLFLLIILVCLIGGLVFYIKTKIEEFSRTAFGTKSLLQGFQKIEQEYVSTPKSIAGVTRLYLPNIMEDFPDFHYDEMRERAEHVLSAYLLSINNNHIDLPDYVNSDLIHQLELHLAMLSSKQYKEHFTNMLIHDCQLNNYTKQKGKCKITFQASIQYYHYVEDNNKEIVSGNKSVCFQTRYNIDVIYIQDRDLAEFEYSDALALNCPNCGAPVKNLGDKFCEYCGSGIVSLNIKTWSVSDVKEV